MRTEVKFAATNLMPIGAPILGCGKSRDLIQANSLPTVETQHPEETKMYAPEINRRPNFIEKVPALIPN